MPIPADTHPTVPPLPGAASQRLLDQTFPALTGRVRRRILDDARGNPLALLKLPVALENLRHAHSLRAPEVLPVTDRLQSVFAARVAALPTETSDLLLLAALDGTGSCRSGHDSGYRRCRPSFTVGRRPILAAGFDDLFNLVHDPATLIAVWDRVASNLGARTAGVDGLTVADLERITGVPGFLDDLRAHLRAGTFGPYRCGAHDSQTGRVGEGPAAGCIPTVADRVVQATLSWSWNRSSRPTFSRSPMGPGG